MMWRFVVVLVVGVAACDSGGPTREWMPQDHEGEQKGAGQVAATAETGDATLIEVTWQQNCAICHGLAGRGDTPQGQMLKVPDLVRPELEKIDDATLMATVKQGRNKMPSFDKLPDKVIAGLVRQVRAFSRPPSAGSR